MKFLALLSALFAAAPLSAVEVARVQVVSPVTANMMGAAAVGTDIHTRIGPLSGPSLTGATLSVTSKLSVPTLAPSVIPSAPEPVFMPQAGGYSAPAVAPQAVSAVGHADAAALAPSGGASLLQQNAEQKNAPAAAVTTLQSFVAQMESSRISGKDISNDLSGRFFDQSGNRGPPLAVPAEASDLSAPQLPPGVKSVAVDTVRTARDVDRLIPDGKNSDELKAELKRNVSQMAPYQIYTYRDAVGGSFVGIDLAANPNIVAQIPELQPHEVTLIKRLQLVNSDIRVLVREDGKTPDLVIGNQVVEMKSVLNNFPMEKLVDKANAQVLVHGQRHGLGHGTMVLDLAEEKTIPLARVQSTLNAWQAKAEKVVLDRIMVFSQTEMKVFVRRVDGTYQIEAPAAVIRSVVNERPMAPAERGRVQAMLRNGIEKSPVLALSL